MLSKRVAGVDPHTAPRLPLLPSLIPTRIPHFLSPRSRSSTTVSRHHRIATHRRILPAATSYDDAMPTAVALLRRRRRALQRAVLQPTIIYATTAQRPCYIATTGARHGRRRAVLQPTTRKLQPWPGKAGTGKLRCCHRLRRALETSNLRWQDPWRTGVATGYVRCWNQHGSELQPRRRRCYEWWGAQLRAEDEMLPMAIRDAGTGSVESCNRRRNMLQAATRGCRNRQCGKLQPACHFATTDNAECWNQRERMLPRQARELGCFHGETRELQPAWGRCYNRRPASCSRWWSCIQQRPATASCGLQEGSSNSRLEGYPRSYASDPYVVLTSACGGSGLLDFGCKHLERAVRAIW